MGVVTRSPERSLDFHHFEARHELANLNHGGNTVAPSPWSGGTALSRPPHRSSSALSAEFPFRSRQASGIGGIVSLGLMIRNVIRMSQHSHEGGVRGCACRP